MALILVIDSDSVANAVVARLRRDLADRENHEIVYAPTCDDALAIIDRAIPDLVLFPVFMTAGQESAIMSRLSGVSTGDPLSALLVPLLASTTVKRSGSAVRWFYWFKPRTRSLVEGRDIKALSAQIRRSLVESTAPVEPSPVAQSMDARILAQIAKDSDIQNVEIREPVNPWSRELPVSSDLPRDLIENARVEVTAFEQASAAPKTQASRSGRLLPDMVERPSPNPPTALLPDSENASVLREWADEVLGIPARKPDETPVESKRSTAHAATPSTFDVREQKKADAVRPAPVVREREVLPPKQEAATADILDVPSSPSEERQVAAVSSSQSTSRQLTMADSDDEPDIWSDEASDAASSASPAISPSFSEDAVSDQPKASRWKALASRWPSRQVWLSGVAATILVVVGLAFASNIAAAAKRLAAETPTGIAELHSLPTGSEVWSGGKKVGVTPLNAAMSVGQHVFEFRYRSAVRAVELGIAADKRTVHTEDFKMKPVGALTLTSNPTGATVTLDGEERGVTPLTLSEVTAGTHTVVFKAAGGGSVRRSVTVEQDKTATLQTSIFSGWVAIFSPFEVRISENGKELIPDDQQQVMLSPGQHRLRLVNEGLAYRTTQVVDVAPGDVTRLSIDLPRTTASITSNPPAEIWVDGVHVGQTPLAALPIDVGAREFVFRHPIMGERRVVRIATTAKLVINVDLTQPTE